MNHIEQALEEANIAFELGEVPVGAVIVKEGKVISKAHNLKEKSKDVTAHAEIIAIREASKALDNWRLKDCSMYVTLEPCPMCISAIAQARIKDLYIGAPDVEKGACGSMINLAEDEYFDYAVNVHWLYDERCGNILSDFFKKKRKERKL
ncbi:nucleoside deaminase [Clostridium sp. 19966]|uniref:nucleoside deaminase n=1 Tax=Clostridium sp. 19966 TaxID=2768166 RepID=UPI0028DFD53F|nr:nucleoside deaminase [Clostridium sp. 19966]MDT8719403.1 nucleoside deaminase [Clostridium sp. 19966]